MRTGHKCHMTSALTVTIAWSRSTGLDTPLRGPTKLTQPLTPAVQQPQHVKMLLSLVLTCDLANAMHSCAAYAGYNMNKLTVSATWHSNSACMDAKCAHCLNKAISAQSSPCSDRMLEAVQHKLPVVHPHSRSHNCMLNVAHKATLPLLAWRLSSLSMLAAVQHSTANAAWSHALKRCKR